ncbi:hypothetical protein OS493_037552 [Desmophyllum pertusum]|uniref:Uncharacterized protein n=1 Tax=Desmophyllum pertusum TaxID=174260 RepID=A0A9W9Z6X9_9CNID|nr:hypothetical protein OS493_037552 [Desmophyllum pertusum]
MERRMLSRRIEIYHLLEDFKLAAGCLPVEEKEKQEILQEISFALESNVLVLLECPHLLHSDSGWSKGSSLLFFDASTAETVRGPFEISRDTIDKIDQLEFSPDALWAVKEIEQSRDGEMTVCFSRQVRCNKPMAGVQNNTLVRASWIGNSLESTRETHFSYHPTCSFCSRLREQTESNQESSLATVRQLIIELYPNIFQYQGLKLHFSNMDKAMTVCNIAASGSRCGSWMWFARIVVAGWYSVLVAECLRNCVHVRVKELNQELVWGLKRELKREWNWELKRELELELERELKRERKRELEQEFKWELEQELKWVLKKELERPVLERLERALGVGARAGDRNGAWADVEIEAEAGARAGSKSKSCWS